MNFLVMTGVFLIIMIPVALIMQWRESKKPKPKQILKALWYMEHCGEFNEKKLRHMNALSGGLYPESAVVTFVKAAAEMVPSDTELDGWESLRKMIRDSMQTVRQPLLKARATEFAQLRWSACKRTAYYAGVGLLFSGILSLIVLAGMAGLGEGMLAGTAAVIATESKNRDGIPLSNANDTFWNAVGDSVQKVKSDPLRQVDWPMAFQQCGGVLICGALAGAAYGLLKCWRVRKRSSTPRRLTTVGGTSPPTAG